MHVCKYILVYRKFSGLSKHWPSLRGLVQALTLIKRSLQALTLNDSMTNSTGRSLLNKSHLALPVLKGLIVHFCNWLKSSLLYLINYRSKQILNFIIILITKDNVPHLHHNFHFQLIWLQTGFIHNLSFSYINVLLSFFFYVKAVWYH